LNDLSEIKFKKPPLEIPEKRQKKNAASFILTGKTKKIITKQPGTIF